MIKQEIDHMNRNELKQTLADFIYGFVAHRKVRSYLNQTDLFGG